MRVFIVCRIHLSKNMRPYAKIHSVYDTYEVADEFVQKKHLDGDFNWAIVSKTLRSKLVVPRVKVKKVKEPLAPFSEKMSWLFGASA